MKPVVKDWIALVSTGVVASVLLTALGWLISYEDLSIEWFPMILLTVFVFGTSGYMCFSWIRKEKLRRTWPLAMTFVGLLTIHVGVIGGIIRLWHLRLRGPGWLLVLVIEIPIVGIALELARDYSKARKAASFSGFHSFRPPPS
jgi:hypothetical protein